MAREHNGASALEHFDPAGLFDALSTGIIVLDAQLCAIYANVAAQDLLAFSLNQARGRPFTDFLHDSSALRTLLRRVLSSGEGIAERELTVRPAATPRETRTLDITMTPLEGQITGNHLLLELADATQRQRINLKMQEVTRFRMATHPVELDLYYSC